MVYCQYNWTLEKSFLIDEKAVTPVEELHVLSVEKTESTSPDFLTVMKDFVASVSPLIEPCVPFLLTDTGRKSAARQRLPDNLFWSSRTDVPAAESVQHSVTGKCLPCLIGSPPDTASADTPEGRGAFICYFLAFRLSFIVSYLYGGACAQGSRHASPIRQAQIFEFFRKIRLFAYSELKLGKKHPEMAEQTVQSHLIS